MDDRTGTVWRGVLALAWVVMLLAWPMRSGAAPVLFSAARLPAGGAQFALTFIDGATPAGSISASGFSTDGIASAGATTGDVSGTLGTGLLLQNTSFLREALIDLSDASIFSFLFQAGGAGPLPGEFGDSFSIFLLDPISGLSLVETDDPTGNDALLLYVIDGSGMGSLQVYSPVAQGEVLWRAEFQTGEPPGVVPAPGGPLLVLLALAAAALASLRRRTAALRLAWLPALVLVLGFGAGPAQAEIEDVTADVQITRGGLVPNRTTGTLDAQVTVTNRSGVTLHGPLRLALESATPANVALYNSYGRLPHGADYVELPLPAGTLAPGAAASVTVRLLAYGQGVGATTFSVHGLRLTPSRTATLNVEAVYAAGLAGPGETPVGAGWQVQVDGVVRGLTDGSSRLQIQVPTSARVVAVVRPPSEGGSDVLPDLTGGSSHTVRVVVDEGKSMGVGSLVRLEQAQLGVLSRTVQAVSLRVFQDERAVRLATLDNVDLIDAQGRYTNLSSLFALQGDGSVRAAGAAFLQAVAGRSGPLTLEIGGTDAAGQLHVARTSFQLADHRVRVQLVAPPSNPSLPLAGVRITASLLNTDVRFVAQSDASGYIVLPDSPAGNLSFSGGTTVNGIVYSVNGSAALTRDTLVRLTLRAPADILANVPAISTQLLPSNARRAAAEPATAVPPEAAAQRRAKHDRLGPARAERALVTPTSTLVSASAAAAEQNVVVQGTAQLNVPRGTKKLTLTFNVFTFEYPEYVLAQSIFNDVWSVSVLSAGGASLFDITRQINSQLTQEPVWRPDGSTGPVKRVIDVESLAAAADTTVTLRVTSVNIGDSLLTTVVNATLDTSESLVIGTITRGTNPATANDGNYFSVPRPSARNRMQRTFDVALTKPSGSILTGVSVQLLNSGLSALQTALPETAPGAAGVAVVRQDDTSATLRVRVTHDNPASTIGGQPPPTRDIRYRFTVKATSSEGSELEDEKDSAVQRSLWRMPDGLGRYSTRDPGGDDWAARGTYTWLQTYSALIREINDISGEHGRNIGHTTHGRGTDIDAYHFYRFPGAVSGGDNYNALLTNVVAAFGTLSTPPPAAATQAFNRVAAWITATRVGLTALANLDSVARLIYCSGRAAQGLPAGWCSALIRTGTVTRTITGSNGPPVQQTLNFGGSFDNAKLTYRDDHNDHLHVTLDPEKIGE